MSTPPILAEAWAWLWARPWPAITVTTVMVVVAVVARDRLLDWRHRRFADGARWVTIAAPPEVAPESAAAFWTILVGVLTPAVWRRRVFGIPHVAWEYTWTGTCREICVTECQEVPLWPVGAGSHR